MREHLASLCENKAPGTDGMGSSFVKNMVGGIEIPLVLIFQRSRPDRCLRQWKAANVTAIYKRKEQRCDPVKEASELNIAGREVVRENYKRLPG